jgi:hypothetical protein
MATFAFWNTERIGNAAPTGGPQWFKLGYFEQTVSDIITQFRPTFFVCAEITHKGAELAHSLQQQPFLRDYRCTFVPVVSPGNPCNFMVMHKNCRGVEVWGPFGTNVRRPYLVCKSTGGLRVAFAHLLSGGSAKTEDELLTVLDDISARGVHALCGDINLDHATHFGSPNSQLCREVRQVGFATLAPSTPTFQKASRRMVAGVMREKMNRKTFDYCIYAKECAPNISRVDSAYTHDHEVIDHAPVIYKIKMSHDMDRG